MRNDPYFKFLAVIILAGVVLACFSGPLSAAPSALRHVENEARILLARV